MASSDPGSRVRAGRGWVNCATVAVSAGGAVRDTRANSACSSSVRMCVKAHLTWRAGRRCRSLDGRVELRRDGKQGDSADDLSRMLACLGQ